CELSQGPPCLVDRRNDVAIRSGHRVDVSPPVFRRVFSSSRYCVPLRQSAMGEGDDQTAQRELVPGHTFGSNRELENLRGRIDLSDSSIGVSRDPAKCQTSESIEKR